MKQFVVYIFLCVFICSISCSNYLIVFQSKQIKTEGALSLKQKKDFRNKDLSISDFENYKHNDHELIIEGRFYEYKIVSKNSKSIQLALRYDEKETKFEKWKSKQKKHPKKHIKKVSIQLYLTDFEIQEFRSFYPIKYFPKGNGVGKLASYSELKLNPPQLL